MKPGKHDRPVGPTNPPPREIRSDPHWADRKTPGRQPEESLLFLRSRLARVRELPNGFDFLFTGNPTQLHDNAHEFISRESTSVQFLNFDHTLIEDTLLLRITGPVDRKELIKKYFGSPKASSPK